MNAIKMDNIKNVYVEKTKKNLKLGDSKDNNIIIVN